MEQSVEEFVDKLLTREALEKPSDKVKPEELVMELPKWFDEEKFNQGRRFYWDNYFGISTATLLGLVSVFAVPSILKVLYNTRRSNSSFTAYKRYLSTFQHVYAWFAHELKPNSLSWRSLHAVRTRHVKAGLASKMKGGDHVSQRDIAITLWAFIAYSMLKPDKLGIRQMKEGDWEAFNHVWRTLGHMLGLEDRYNICRSTVEETRQVCQLLLDRVYTPCLENVPEYFEHMTYVMLDGMWCINTAIDIPAILYLTRYFADIPGYIYTEEDRIKFERRLREELKGKPLDSGVDSSTLVQKSAVEGLTPRTTPRLLYLKDYQNLSSVPEYKKMGFFSRFKLNSSMMVMSIYSTYLGHLYFNFSATLNLLKAKYFPYIAYLRFGYRRAVVNIFEESPKDDTKLKTNEEYYKERRMPWYSYWLSFIFP